MIITRIGNGGDRGVSILLLGELIYFFGTVTASLHSLTHFTRAIVSESDGSENYYIGAYNGREPQCRTAAGI